MVTVILDRSDCGHDGQAVQVVGVLDCVQRCDQLRVAERKTDPHSSERVGLREGPQDEKVPIPFQQAGARLRREVHVGLVEDDDASRRGDDLFNRSLR
jgi:hypothetical protein